MKPKIEKQIFITKESYFRYIHFQVCFLRVKVIKIDHSGLNQLIFSITSNAVVSISIGTILLFLS
jgi:hypothetical protein